MKKPLLILVFALVCSAITFAQTTIYVNSISGDDTTGDGTMGTPYKTFHKGYTIASSGDVLDLTGTFNWNDADETGDVTTNGYMLAKSLTIQGQGASSTIIQAATTANSTDRRIFTINSSHTINVIGLTLRHGNLTSNGSGGAIRVGSITTDVTIDACVLESNNASTTSYSYSYGGGAIFCYNSNALGGQLIIKNSIIRNNTSTNCWGGGIYHYRGSSGTSTLVVENTTISGNSAANGTAMAGYYGAYIITNSTITGNSATTTVIMSNHNYGLFYMTNVTFAYNLLGASGRGLYLESVSDIRIKNSIIAQNKRSDNSINDYYRSGGVLNSSTNNIIEMQGTSDFTNGVNGNIIGVQGLLNLSNTLDINDSSVISSTLALSANSVAINAGDNTANGSVIVPTADQRGVERVGLVDIGAYEFDGTLNTAPEINSLASVNFAENATGTIIDVQSTDADGDTEGSGLTYAFSTETAGGVDNDLFAIDANTGVITFLASPDYEVPDDDDVNNDYEVQITVTDSGSLAAVQDITITVTDQTSEPVIESIVDFEATSGRHNLTSGTRLYHIAFKTPTCTSYDLTQLGANIEATSAAGNVKLGLYSSDRSTLLYETSTIAVTGGVDEYVSAAISPGTLTLEKNSLYWIGIIGDAEIWIDADENPVNNGTGTDISTGTYAMYKVVPDVATNSVSYPVFPVPATTEIVWYRAVSLVAKGTQVPSTIDTSVTLSDATITANNQSATYQWVNCSDMSSIDGETSSSFTATVSGDYAVIVTEGVCSSTSSCTTVEVNNTPVITSSSTGSFAENATGTVLDVHSTDADGDTEGSGLTYAFSTNASGGVDNALFAIDTNTGVITFLAAPDYENIGDDDTNNDYEVQVTVTDSGSLTAVQDITITVTDVIEAASFTIDAITNVYINENTTYTSVIPNITGTPIGSVKYTLGGTDAADFTIDDATGVVSMVGRDYENAEDDNTDNVYELTITATDADGNSDTEDWTVTIDDDNGAEVLAQIGLEGDNPDTINSVVTIDELNSIIGLVGVVLENETAYQDYIDTNSDSVSSPALLAEVQALINAVNASLGNETFDSFTFKMYPNPVESKLNISAQVEIEQVSLFNLIGQKVFELNINSKTAELDLSLLSVGVYNVIIKTQSAISTSKLVKQ